MQFLRYLFTILTLTLGVAVYAAHVPDGVEPGDSVNEIQLPLTKESAAELIRIETKGKILSVNKKQQEGNIIFRVKVLHDNGKIKIYRLDAETGHPPD